MSENYLFLARVQKLFYLLPAIQKSGKLNDAFKAELKALMRFTMASHACLSRLMSSDRRVPSIDNAIMTCMDAVLEMFNIKEMAAERKNELRMQTAVLLMKKGQWKRILMWMRIGVPRGRGNHRR